MREEKRKKIKEENGAKILDQFTAKMGLYLKEIARTGITMKDIEKKLREKGMSSEEIERIKKGNKEKGEANTEIADMTGDMTDTEFELIVDEIYERMKDNMYQIGKQRVRNMLDHYRTDLQTLQSMDITFKFEYNNGEFNQILGRIRRKK